MNLHHLYDMLLWFFHLLYMTKQMYKIPEKRAKVRILVPRDTGLDDFQLPLSTYYESYTWCLRQKVAYLAVLMVIWWGIVSVRDIKYD